MNRAADDEMDAMTCEETAGLWCARLAGGALGVEDQAAFEAWLEADPAHSAAYDKALSVWHGLQAIGSAPELIGHRADALDALRRANEARWSRRAGRRWGWAMAIAASLVLTVAASLWLMRPGGVDYATAIGERRAVMLEDGSRLSLDAASRVEVDYAPERRALVLTAGRAKFDVAHDPARPFTVQAGGRTVVATGTSFSVELLAGRLHVIVYEGRVAVLNGGPDDRVIQAVRGAAPAASTALTPGRELVAQLEGGGAPVVRSDASRSLAWEGGQLDFVDEPLGSAIERLGRYNRERIVVGDRRAGAIQINGVFNAGDTEALLEAIGQAYPVRIRREGEAIVIRSVE